eukprot:PhM_4_TR15112/c0_g2_i1/m.44019
MSSTVVEISSSQHYQQNNNNNNNKGRLKKWLSKLFSCSKTISAGNNNNNNNNSIFSVQKCSMMSSPSPPATTTTRCTLCTQPFGLLSRRLIKCASCGAYICSACARNKRCLRCHCPVTSLDDTTLKFVMSFLTPQETDATLKVCKWFQRLVVLPYPSVPSIGVVYEVCEEISSMPGRRMLRAVDKHTRQLRTLRVLSKDAICSARGWQHFQHFVDVSFAVHHPNFVDTFAVHQTPSEVVVATEYAELTPLAMVTAKLREDELIHVAYQLFRAIKYLHHDIQAVHASLEKCIMIERRTRTVKIVLASGVTQYGQRLDLPDAREAMAALLATQKPPSDTRVFVHRYKPIPRPPPVIIPGGRDENLFRKSEKFRRAARQRSVNTTFSRGGGESSSGLAHQDSCYSSYSSFASFVAVDRTTFLVTPLSACSSMIQKPRRVGFVPPEVVELCALRRSKQARPKELMAGDMFTCGVVLYKACCGTLPWTSHSWNVLAHDMWTRKPSTRLMTQYNISLEAQECILRLLDPDFTARWTVQAALASAWIQNGGAEMLLQPATPAAPRGATGAARKREIERTHNEQEQ